MKCCPCSMSSASWVFVLKYSTALIRWLSVKWGQQCYPFRDKGLCALQIDGQRWPKYYYCSGKQFTDFLLHNHVELRGWGDFYSGRNLSSHPSRRRTASYLHQGHSSLQIFCKGPLISTDFSFWFIKASWVWRRAWPEGLQQSYTRYWCAASVSFPERDDSSSLRS